MLHIPRTGGLVAGVHGQLSQADVHRRDGHVRPGDVAQRGAAQHVGAVGEVLHRHVRAAADLAEDGPAHAVGGVLLVGALLEHDAAVHQRAVSCVGLLRVVRMQRVGVVRGHHEAGGQTGVQRLAIRTQALRDAADHVREEGGIRALARAAAHLFVVKHTAEIDVPALPRLQQRPKAGVGALQIVQPRCGDVAVLRAPEPGLHAVVEVEIPPEHVLRGSARDFRDLRLEAALRGDVAVEGQHVHLRVELAVLVHIPLHVDGQVGNQRRVAPEVHQTAFHALRRAHQHSPGDPQWAVQPGA